MKRRVYWTMGLVVLMISMLCFSAWAVPGLVNYQGKLTDSGGKALDGTFSMTFRLFNVETDGSSIWEETQSVLVTNGIYNVQLGTVNPLAESYFVSDDLYLEVVAEGETLSPRLRLTSTAFSMKAGVAEDADTLDGMDSTSLDQSAHVGDTTNPHSVTAAQTGAATLSDIAWGNLSGIPADFADGTDDTGITTETDPTIVDPSIKDGVSWGELSGIPSDFADGVDNDTNTTYSAGTGLDLVGTEFNVEVPLSITGSNLSPILDVTNSGDGSGVAGSSISGRGVSGDSTSGWGLYGYSQSGIAVYGLNTSTFNYGTIGTSSYGVHGYSTSDYGVYGDSLHGYGVYGDSANSTGVYGEGFYGVYGYSYSGSGVYGKHHSSGNYGHLGTSSYGVYGNSSSGDGVHGVSGAANGVTGYAIGTGSGRHGVYGETYCEWGWASGVYGEASRDAANGVTGWNSAEGPGVYGHSDSGYAVYGGTSTGWAGYFPGRVFIGGPLTKPGGSFQIDHPLDPENKYLNHSFVESPDMMNIYNGNVVLDANGERWVELPEWFEALNKDFRYQLTPIGAPGPNLYIAQKIADNRFKIAGGSAAMEVSWQVTGIRQDPWAEANRISVEEDKAPEEVGFYLHPESYGQPEEKGMEWGRNPEMMQQMKEMKELERPAETDRPLEAKS